MNSLRPSPSDPLQDDSPLQRLFPLLALFWLLLFWFLFYTAPLPNASNAERTVTRTDIIGLLPEIYEDLLSPPADPATASSWSNLTQRLDVLAVALLIVTGSLATGRLALRGLGLLSSLPRADGWALSGGVGFSLVSLGTLGLGLVGLLWQPLFILLLLLPIVLELFLCWRHRKEISVISPPANRWLRRGVLAISVPFLLCMLLGSMLPSTDFDVKEYHLGGPKEYFLAGRIHFLAHNVYTSFPFLTEMLSLAGMVVRGDWERGSYAGQTVLMCFAPLTALGVFCTARRIAGPDAGWLAALCSLTIPWTYRISTIAYTEGALCCYVVLSLLMFLIWHEGNKDAADPDQTGAALWGNGEGEKTTSSRFNWGVLLVLGFLAGSAVATKYPGMVLVAIPYGVAVAVSLLLTPRRSLQKTICGLLIYTAGVLLAFGPWMAKNLLETGNPVYPLLYGVFGGVDWDAAMHRKWQAAHPARLFSGDWDDFAGVIYKNDWQSSLLFGFAPLAFFCRRKERVALVWGDALLLLAAWFLLTHRIDRFWVPMNSVMSVLAGCGVAGIWGLDCVRYSSAEGPGRKSKRTASPQQSEALSLRLLRPVSGVLLAGTLVYNLGFISTPLCGYNAWLGSYAAMEQQTKTQSVQIVDWLKLPAGSKVLFVGEAELFNAKFPYAYNTVFDKSLLEEWTSTSSTPGQWNWRPTSEILETLRQHGITHVLVNWNEILRYRTTYGYTDFVTPARLQELVEQGVLEPVPLPDQIAARPWERIDAGWKKEIERWAPELKMNARGEMVMLQYQCFRVPAVAGNEGRLR